MLARLLYTLVPSVVLVGALAFGSRAEASGLEDYLKKADETTSCKVISTTDVPDGKVVRFAFTSQTWQGIRWTHDLNVVVPKTETYPDAMLLFITGGSIGGEVRAGDLAMAFGLAKLCGARVALLPQVPNQPLLGNKREDTLIAETFVRYLETKDASWPLLFPMVKSAVKAMDGIQAWAKAEGKQVDRFVVTGASKRGWTTWLTGASDPRVKAIAPMVIPTLNFRAQNEHQIEDFGAYSDQINDYTSRGLMERIKEPEGEALWKMVDPLSFVDKLTMPKLQINGTNDPYWTLGSMNIYWKELKGQSRVVYLPNAGHGLEKHREYALNGIGAQFRSAIGGKPLPDLTWSHEAAEDGKLRLTVQSDVVPKSAQLWSAKSMTKDFRKSTWAPVPLTAGAKIVGELDEPTAGYVAYFGDLEFEIDGLLYHLSTQIARTPDIKK